MPISSVGRATNTGTPRAAKIVLTAILVVAGFNVVGGLVAPLMLGYRDRVSKPRADITAFVTALATYKADTGEYPTTAQGLRALREQPDGVKGWDGPYIRIDVPKDPWNHDYVYRFPGEHSGEPDIICYGADGQPGGDGINADIVSWKKP